MKENKEKNPQENPKNHKKENEEKLEKLLADVEHWKNEYFRAYADMQNLRKAIEADHREAIKYRAEGFIDNLLPILDGFHIALQAEVKSEEMKNFLIGFQYIYNNLVSVLENEGVKELAPKIGDTFDPKYMSAMETVVDDDDPNKVKKVVTKGYKLHDRLIRPANVVVSIKSQVEEENKEEENSPVHLDA